MEENKQNRYHIRRKFLRTVFGVFSLSGILFAFQACYGTPQDFGQDIQIRGKVTSSANKSALPGIKVLVSESGQYTQSASDGTFSLWCERMPSYNLVFSDTDGPQNGQYQECDTLVLWDEQADDLTVNVELK